MYLYKQSTDMKIYTSYFAKTKALRAKGIVPVGISLYPPKWFDGGNLAFLAPSRKMLSDDITTEQYIEMYHKEILSRFDINLFRNIINQTAQGKDVALCCFEKPDEFCHRHLFADWVKEKFGYEIEEYVFEEKTEIIKKEIPKPLSLFD